MIPGGYGGGLVLSLDPPRPPPEKLIILAHLKKKFSWLMYDWGWVQQRTFYVDEKRRSKSHVFDFNQLLKFNLTYFSFCSFKRSGFTRTRMSREPSR